MHALGRTAALASHVREVTRQLERGSGSPSGSTWPGTCTSASQRLFGISMALGSDQAAGKGGSGRCAAEIEAAIGDLREALIGSAGRSAMEVQGTSGLS